MAANTPRTLTEINDLFRVVVGDLKPLYYAMPLNEAEEKKRFFDGTIENPEFTYRELSYDPVEKLAILSTLDDTDASLQGAVRERRERAEQKLVLLQHRGNADIVIPLSIQIFGTPDADLTARAVRILETTESEPEELVVNAEQLKEAIEAAYAKYGLTEWRVELAEKWMTTVYNFDSCISICKERMFTENDLTRLAAHEVGVHVLRHMNHHLQNEDIMETLFAGEYLATEEGLASYAEEVTGSATNNSIRDYAGRVLAVASVVDRHSFRDTFVMLQQYGFSDERAWHICVRTYRGGGLTRDIAYLKGYFAVKDYVAAGGDLSLLYVGKVDLSHIEMVKAQLATGALQPPTYMPDFFK